MGFRLGTSVKKYLASEIAHVTHVITVLASFAVLYLCRPTFCPVLTIAVVA